MWKPDCFARKATLPWSIKAVVIPNNDATFDVYLNDTLTQEEQENALVHEIEHIKQDHFYKTMHIADIENSANKGARE
jgi:hypothetical protein